MSYFLSKTEIIRNTPTVVHYIITKTNLSMTCCMCRTECPYTFSSIIHFNPDTIGEYKFFGEYCRQDLIKILKENEAFDENLWNNGGL